MKRISQFVVLVTLALLASQPALAGLRCTLRAPATHDCMPGCTMAMFHASPSSMGAGCTMASQSGGSVCEQDCCHSGLYQGFAQLAAKADAKTHAAALLLAVTAMAPVPDLAVASAPTIPLASDAPARYILLQVFRI